MTEVGKPTALHAAIARAVYMLQPTEVLSLDDQSKIVEDAVSAMGPSELQEAAFKYGMEEAWNIIAGRRREIFRDQLEAEQRARDERDAAVDAKYSPGPGWERHPTKMQDSGDPDDGWIPVYVKRKWGHGEIVSTTEDPAKTGEKLVWCRGGWGMPGVMRTVEEIVDLADPLDIPSSKPDRIRFRKALGARFDEFVEKASAKGLLPSDVVEGIWDAEGRRSTLLSKVLTAGRAVVDEMAGSISVEFDIDEKMMTEAFSVDGRGERATWAGATAEQHRKAAGYLISNHAGPELLEAARHEAAARYLEEKSLECLAAADAAA